jgi:hypothetical protein
MPAPKQLVLPFAAQSENRKEPFSNEAEAAAIFALAELERKNGGLSNRQEKTAFITKIGYPLWLIVRGDFTYVFDGLNKSSFGWNFFEASQTDFIIEDFDASFKIREQYIKFLSNYQKSFQQALNRKEVTCSGLIANSEFLGEMGGYRKEAAEVIWQQSGLGLLSPSLNETDASATINNIETLQATFKEKTEKLRQLNRLIFKTTNGYIEGLCFESSAVSEEAEAKIKAQKEIINPKIENLTNEYKKQINNLEKSIEREQAPLEKQKSQLEKSIKTAQTDIERYKKQSRIQADKNNKRSEETLKKKIKNEKQELDEHEKQLKIVERRLKALVDQKNEENLRLKREFDEKVRIERLPIVNLEVLRDEKLVAFKQEILKLEKFTKPVLEDLDKLVKQREDIIAKTEPLGLKSDLKLKSNALFYVPFYVAAYNGASSKRYFIVPPASVDSLGFSHKLKGALGRAKIRDLLSARFRSVSFLAEKIRLTAASSSEFEAQLETLAQNNNLLTANMQIKNGLFTLKGEGWLSEAEYQNFAVLIGAF